MAVALDEQLCRLLTAAALGALLGLAYDLLRPPRRRTGPAVGAALDLMYALLAGCALFVYAMGAGSGRLGLWELGAAAAGFALYMALLSPLLLPVFGRALDAGAAVGAGAKKIGKNLELFAKNSFSNGAE